MAILIGTGPIKLSKLVQLYPSNGRCQTRVRHIEMFRNYLVNNNHLMVNQFMGQRISPLAPHGLTSGSAKLRTFRSSSVPDTLIMAMSHCPVLASRCTTKYEILKFL